MARRHSQPNFAADSAESTSTTSVPYFNQLPASVVEVVAGFLRAEDVGKLGATCRLHKVCGLGMFPRVPRNLFVQFVQTALCYHTLWRQRLAQDFPLQVFFVKF